MPGVRERTLGSGLAYDPMRTVLLYAALCVCSAVHAQPDAEVEFLHGLLGVDAETLTFGEVPPSIAPFLPSGTVAIGVLQGRRGPHSDGTLFVGRIDAVSDAAEAAYDARTFDGWTRYELWWPSSRHGFTTDHPEERPLQYYSGDDAAEIVQVSFADRPWGGAYVQVSRRARHPQEHVRPEDRPDPSQFSNPLEDALPALTAPEGARQQQTGGGGGRAYSSGAVLHTDLPLEAVASHYAAQMAAGSWTSVSDGGADGLATSLWTRDLNGTVLVATFVVRADGPGQYDLAVSVIGDGD